MADCDDLASLLEHFLAHVVQCLVVWFPSDAIEYQIVVGISQTHVTPVLSSVVDDGVRTLSLHCFDIPLRAGCCHETVH